VTQAKLFKQWMDQQLEPGPSNEVLGPDGEVVGEFVVDSVEGPLVTFQDKTAATVHVEEVEP
jgi:hypothetical protein